MELNQEERKLLHTKLIEVFERTVRFLNSNNLQWWVAYGTAIGAVRHHGMIPWDDDIDIYMPYQDYERLLNMTKEFEGTDLAIDIPFGDNNCCSYAKIYDVKTTIWQVKEYNSIIGLWIDIFPLFQTNKSLTEYKLCVKEYKRLNSRYLRGIRKYDFCEIRNLLKGFHIKTLCIAINNLTIYRLLLKKSINDFKVYISKLDEPNGRYFIFPYEYFDYEINWYPIEWFENTLLFPFHGFYVCVPSGYDKLLTHLYGDYMTPPPLEKQVSHHRYFFFNLDNKFSKTEIIKLLHKHDSVNNAGL